MTDIKWQEPPADQRGGRRGTSKWNVIRAQLRERPDNWALVAENVSAGVVTRQKRPGFEVVGRSRPDYVRGRTDIYMRFVGDSEAGA